ncbi:MAG: ABC transporter permease [bacterium]|nr:ABC transporter permease [bacterium]
MKGPVFHVLRKEVIEMTRSNLIRFLVLAPLLQVLVFGFVATTDVKNVRVIICDEENTPLSRALTERFLHTEYFRVVSFTRQPQKIEKAFSSGKAKIALRIPRGFSEKIKKGKRAKVQVLVDGSDSNQALISMNRAILIIQSFSEYAFAERVAQMKTVVGELASINMQERIWYNPELKSSHTMIPGVVGLILIITTLVATSISLVREKESGNIEQLIVTPVKPYQIITGKIIPYILLGLVDIILITVFSLLIFGIYFKGNFALLIFLSFFMILVNLGIGIYFSTISSTQQQVVLLDIFFLLPNILLSGFIFPIKNMPVVLQYLTYIIPMRYYMVIIRGIFLKGLTFMDLYPQALALFGFSIFIFFMAIVQFKKRLA